MHILKLKFGTYWSLNCSGLQINWITHQDYVT